MMLGIHEEKTRDAEAELLAQRKDLPIDVPDPFFKGPF